MAMVGVIKKFGAMKGFGFISSAEVTDGDIYFQLRNLPEKYQIMDTQKIKIEGCTCTFYLHHAKDGKPQARDIEITNLAPEDGGLSQFLGEVRAYNAEKGFGFLMCPTIIGDVYFNKREVPEDLEGQNLIGQQVSFDQFLTPEGKSQARNVKFLGSSMGMGGMNMMQMQQMQMQQMQMQQMQEQMQQQLAMQNGCGGCCGSPCGGDMMGCGGMGCGGCGGMGCGMGGGCGGMGGGCGGMGGGCGGMGGGCGGMGG
eukprot:CAMPEP_0206462940 /NCGR_PEP_ID=MMETSP0324_2-20121206/26286_1 /ASSEMBLY_ACC=CAM_ASM_000836 /TAXON_ID=2866 /ORGANISM="Crypthecodinium cohnii, Strain Seligo" /LENGTH=254 /DNA_ID=CAMNT_0053935209 /DNA_START=113 /DNA_END=874 /DNA_ORIENTATION=+